ncbi:galactokinase [candidate division NPL-UPA2 bacterium Unc8]|uniref:Galactokinase n=1 Tax=candidate division NPL-UPA2 bacterium Unc8 TaxID=1980939 RepID=A0A399FXT5_UNCN2|nr:Galactokinase [Bacillota bacterium]MBT9137751.1 Galactokinase [Bacillota bacterium]MBT9146311.1 Galactokinase [Bacillota bacterium]RII00266.1 MAG: galactokinase [candidate division NPL-UPA2 bacterium Unc8]
MERIKSVLTKFKEVFGSGESKVFLARAPGRVNLIGEHTDYNKGFVLPIAINQEIIAAFLPRQDRLISLCSSNFSSFCQFSLDEVTYNEKEHWANYVKGVIRVLQEEGVRLSGMSMVLEGDIPIGVGLSSSAATEIVTAVSLQIINGFTISPLEMVKLCQKAENEFVGVNCGIMDQFTSLLGEKDRALFLDCRSLEYKQIPLLFMENLRIVICNTRVNRRLAKSGYYNDRRRECAEGVSHLREFLPEIDTLRDVTIDSFEKYKHHLPGNIKKRCRHVVRENDRVVQAVAALGEDNLGKFGDLMNESHQSLRDDYEVSCNELDLMVEIAREIDGVLGARMTGAGFGGCTVNFVEKKSINQFHKIVTEKYKKETGIQPEIYVCQAKNGAGEIVQ